MSTAQQHPNAAKLSQEDMGKVIERASLLQDRAKDAQNAHTVGDTKKVGAELDIHPRFVDAALRELQEERAVAQRLAAEKKVLIKKVLVVGAGALVALLALGGVGSAGVRSAAAQAALAHANLQTVVQRQTVLVPQLLALSGGEVSGLAALQDAVERAPTVEAQLKSADALQLAMAQALGRLPAAKDDSQSQQRLSLQHEMVGATNRISTERRRYEEALAQWRTAAGGPLGALSIGLRLAPRPPEM